MFKKNDPLVDSVKAVMEHNARERQIEAAVNEEFGVTSKNALPHEIRVKYEQRLAEAKKCMYNEKVNMSKADIAALEHPKKRFDEKDLAALRAGKHKTEKKEELEEKWHEESSKKKDIEEKVISPYGVGMKAAMQSTGDKPPLEKSTIKKAHRIARKVAKKEGIKLKEQAVFEEIRSNLEEQLVSVYESGDQQAFADFVASLSEEQIEILGLNEAMGNPGNPFEAGSGSGWSLFGGSKGQKIYDKPAGPEAPTPKADNPMYKDSAKGTEPEYSKPSIPMGTTSSSMMSTNKNVAPSSGGSNQGTSELPKSPSFSAGKGQDAPGTVSQGGSQVRLSASTNQPGKDSGTLVSKNPKSGSAVASTPTAPKSTGSITSKSPRPGMKPAGSSGVSMGAGGYSRSGGKAYGGSIGSLSTHGMWGEEVKPQIKESFEQFLRNKFLKG